MNNPLKKGNSLPQRWLQSCDARCLPMGNTNMQDMQRTCRPHACRARSPAYRWKASGHDQWAMGHVRYGSNGPWIMVGYDHGSGEWIRRYADCRRFGPVRCPRRRSLLRGYVAQCGSICAYPLRSAKYMSDMHNFGPFNFDRWK